MSDVYGEKMGQGLADETWLAEAGRRGWVVLMKDDRIRYRPAEMGALIEHEVRAFCLTNANLRGAEQVQRIVDVFDAIVERTSEPGPYVYGIYANGCGASGRASSRVSRLLLFVRNGSPRAISIALGNTSVEHVDLRI